VSGGAPPPGRGTVLPPSGPRTATRTQRIALIAGFLGSLLFALWLFQSILTPFVLAAVIAYFLDPPTTRLARHGVPRGLAAGLMILLLSAATLVALLLIYPLLIAQIGVLVTRLPAYVASIGAALRDTLLRLEEALGPELVDVNLRELAIGQVASFLSYLGSSATRVIGGGFALANIFMLSVVMPIVAFYLLRDWSAMITRIESWLPRRSASTLRSLGRDMDRVLAAWLRGQLICCAILAMIYAIGLQLVGLELGLTVGLVTGVLSFIPYIGSITGFMAAMLLAVGQFGNWNGVLLVAGVFLVGTVVEGYIIYPRLLGDRVELHAVWVIFALFAGGVAFGFLGVLLAVPIAAAIGVVARYWLRRYLESPLYLDPPRTGL
jgi:predicted PurR-regulated permease PerM